MALAEPPSFQPSFESHCKGWPREDAGVGTTGRSTGAEMRAGKLPQQLHRRVLQVHETAKLQVNRQWSKVVKAKEEAQGRVKEQVGKVQAKVREIGPSISAKRERVTTEARQKVSQLRHHWQVMRPRPARALLTLARRLQKQPAQTLTQRNVHTGAVLATGGCFWLAGAAPQNFPLLFLAFLVVAFPCRIVYFFKRKWQFFLIDYCYFVNFSVAAFLLFAPNDTRLEACVWSMAVGPVGGAIVLWRCQWVFGLLDHMMSVLVHILPAVALFAHKHSRVADCAGELVPLGCRSAASFAAAAAPDATLDLTWWLTVAPLLAYLLWQLLYFLVVQVWQRPKLLANKDLQNSYRTLARRAARSNNILNRAVRTGSPARRVFMYGAIQFAYTVLATAPAAAMYHSYHASLMYILGLIAASTWNGAEYLYDVWPRLLERQWLEKLKQIDQQSASARNSPRPSSTLAPPTSSGSIPAAADAVPAAE